MLSILNVIEEHLCIGCGACAAMDDSAFRIKWNDKGMFEAVLADQFSSIDLERYDAVCPFSGASDDEDVLGYELYASSCQKHPLIGYFRGTYAGHVKVPGFRERGSSGGLGSWIVAQLLERGEVDAVIHVRPAEGLASDDALFSFRVSKTLAEIADGARSQYFPVQMSEVLRFVKANAGRYVLVGIPCFVKAVRLLARTEPIIGERIRFTVGLVCGHLKSRAFAQLLAWQLGVPPDDLRHINFRKKLPDAQASKYGVEVVGSRDNTYRVESKDVLFGTDWGVGFFKYKACDFCDDVMAETADVTVGDAWLPEFEKDWRGTNVLIVRNAVLSQLIDEGMRNGDLDLQPLSADMAARTQDGGFRHRRQGLAYRLFRDLRLGLWRPRKRVTPSATGLSKRRMMVMDQREKLRDQSHAYFADALRSGKLTDFMHPMRRAVRTYYFIADPMRPLRSLGGKLKRRMLSLFRHPAR